MSNLPTVYFAGGGTGGHIFPNVAIEQHLHDLALKSFRSVYVVSQRGVDQKVMQQLGREHLQVPMKPWRSHPRAWLGMYKSWRESKRVLNRAFDNNPPAAVVATGGFVSVPVLRVARSRGVPTFVVNLDAVPGRANRWLSNQATHRYTVYASPMLRGAKVIGFPLRSQAIGHESAAEARKHLNLDPVSPLLFIVGGSSGAESLNRTVAEVVSRREVGQALRGWQILHLHGQDDPAPLAEAYRKADLRVKLLPFLDEIGSAWSGAAMALSRAGAGSVAEAWANACPTIFLPYPFHRDQHQKHNAMPLVDCHGAEIVDDPADAKEGAKRLMPRLMEWLTDAEARENRRAKLRQTRPTNGASAIGHDLLAVLGK